MMRLKLSVNLQVFGQPLKKAAERAAEIGVSALQVDVRSELKPSELSETGIRQLRHYLTERDLKIESTSFPLRRGLLEPDRLDARISALRQALEWTPRLGANLLSTRIGRIPDDDSSSDFAQLVDVLNDLTQHGNRVGTTLCITPSNDTAESLRLLATRVTGGPLGIDFDPAALVMAGQDPVAAIQPLHERIFHVRVRDGVRDMDGIGQETEIGRGQVDWEACLGLLNEAAFQGWFTIDPTQGHRRPTEAARAVQFLNSLGQEMR